MDSQYRALIDKYESLLDVYNQTRGQDPGSSPHHVSHVSLQEELGMLRLGYSCDDILNIGDSCDDLLNVGDTGQETVSDADTSDDTARNHADDAIDNIGRDVVQFGDGLINTDVAKTECFLSSDDQHSAQSGQCATTVINDSSLSSSSEHRETCSVSPSSGFCDQSEEEFEADRGEELLVIESRSGRVVGQADQDCSHDTSQASSQVDQGDEDSRQTSSHSDQGRSQVRSQVSQAGCQTDVGFCTDQSKPPDTPHYQTIFAQLFALLNAEVSN